MAAGCSGPCLPHEMPLDRATGIAATIGKVFAVIFGIVGLFLLNPFLILIALFIYIGASMESTAVRYHFLLQDVTVGGMMSTPVTTVPDNMPLAKVGRDDVREQAHSAFPLLNVTCWWAW